MIPRNIPINSSALELMKTTEQYWQLNLLECLYNPRHEYALPGVSQNWFAMGNAHYDDYTATGTTPAPFTSNNTCMPLGTGGVNGTDPSQPVMAVFQDVGDTWWQVPTVQFDSSSQAKYELRHGKVRGSVTVTSSGYFVIWFDPYNMQNPVHVTCLRSSDEAWTNPTNSAGMIDPLSASEATYSWDYDPYRGSLGRLYNQDAKAFFQRDLSSLVYIGGAELEVAVSTTTAYSNAGMKSRNNANYESRFFNTPTLKGEYGDPGVTVQAKSAYASYCGSTWSQPLVYSGDNTDATRTRLGQVVQQRLPFIEVSNVIATTGGAPMQINFTASVWLGFTSHTYTTNASLPLITVPMCIPPWFASLAAQGCVANNASSLGTARIINTTRMISTVPTPAHVAAVNHVIARKPANQSGSFLSDLGGVAGSGMKFIGKALGSKVLDKVLESFVIPLLFL